ncbi:MAG: hypothetical protein AAB930_03260 [Patescibacteria group bacterium]
MTRYQTFKAIRTEIDRLNRVIDLKIIKGTKYHREAAKHKILVGSLKRLAAEKLWSSLFSFI